MSTVRIGYDDGLAASRRQPVPVDGFPALPIRTLRFSSLQFFLALDFGSS